jgi:hypothetical protein
MLVWSGDSVWLFNFQHASLYRTYHIRLMLADQGPSTPHRLHMSSLAKAARRFSITQGQPTTYQTIKYPRASQ